MRNLKFKVNDVVEITADKNHHGFTIGSHVTIVRIKNWGNGHFSYVGIDDDGDAMLFDDDDCTSIKGFCND